MGRTQQVHNSSEIHLGMGHQFLDHGTVLFPENDSLELLVAPSGILVLAL